MEKKTLYLFSILSGILLSLAWFNGSTGFFLFSGFLPLLLVEDYLHQHKRIYKSIEILKYAALTIFIWNLLATWWIKNASWAGLFIAVLINTLQFSLIIYAFHYTRRLLGNGMGYFSLILFWIIYEHFNINAEISWPWLTLGYGFARDIKFIQWYEYTGALGGSLWVLLVNVILFNAYKIYFQFKHFRSIRLHLGLLIVLIITPVSFSFIRYHNYKEKGEKCNIVIIQPNIDPYKKFTEISSRKQTEIMLKQAGKYATPETDYFVGPETAINNNIWLENLMKSPEIRMIKAFITTYPNAHFITGAITRKKYDSPKTPTAKQLKDTVLYYDSFNSALQIDTSDAIQIYHKSLLVTGIEKMPYPGYLNFLKKYTLRLGGTFRSHGTQKNRSVFVNKSGEFDSLKIGPVICWESIFGEYVTDYVKNGAQLLFVLTNDGWWGDTPGYRQHNTYSQLRAIETRRSIARSANTGISCLINQRGDIIKSLGWGKEDAIQGTIQANAETTFYVKHGDYIARVSQFFGLLIVIYIFVRKIMNKRSINRL
jgi:apolipoprotein N-acyltransferase